MSSPQPTSNQHHHHHHRHVIYVIPPIAGAAVTVSLLTLLLFIYRRLKHSLSSKSHSPENHSNNRRPRRFSFSVLRRATANFHHSRRIGKGGFGAVYSAMVNHRHVAVKLMDSGSLQGEREFHNEIALADRLVDSDRVVRLLGFATSRRRRRMCLVYELMRNGNLQDCLLHKKLKEVMEWSSRHRIAVDVAKGLAFLHHECDPPIIHGDVKPSNVLLDDYFVAKIADFGLARLKLVDNYDTVINVNTNNIEHEVVINVNDTGNNVEDSGSVFETESVTTTGFEDGSVVVDQSPVRVGLAVETSPETVMVTTTPEGLESVVDKESDLEGGVEGGRVVKNVDGSVRGLGRDWWRKKENGGGRGSGGGGGGGSEQGKVKEYVMEWMGMEVAKDRPDNDWNVGGASTSVLEVKKAEKVEKKKGKKKMDWWMSMDDGKMSKKDKRRPVREWWKEEYSEELAKKKKKKKKKKHEGEKSDHEENWWPRDEANYLDQNKKKTRSRSRTSSRSSVDWWLDGLSGDLWKGRHPSYDSMSGEIPKSGGISSTPSMRGTVCYIAPEYSMGGDLSEKCDVYSFGVLMLVLIAGRRPLQVTGSPMSEFHKANLLSWARQLARSGKLLDLVDDKICSLNKEQAGVCIIIALCCLQKSPARRPSMKEVVGMLTGELPPPELPVEYSPSHASKYPHRSRKKLR
ncbi:receptor-like serine/threonine-protein kinase At2g45590 [Silene latifolia]|uniref:receptor-like serine/threonine-protein kinase At2g45590 n=1 Tax=Silene latifolia TaxID=37657 RepID=UPI003D781742